LVVRSGYPGISAAGRGGYPGISPATNVGISYPGILATREFLATRGLQVTLEFLKGYPGIVVVTDFDQVRILVVGYPGITGKLPGSFGGRRHDGF